MMMRQLLAGLALALALPGSVCAAGEADVVKAEAMNSGDGSWRFSVTVRHADEGWDHYANRFEVLDPAGKVLGTRVLLHPHEHEQPFTRSLAGVVIPDDVKKVRIRANDSVHETGGIEIELELPQ